MGYSGYSENKAEHRFHNLTPLRQGTGQSLELQLNREERFSNPFRLGVDSAQEEELQLDLTSMEV